MTDEPKTQAQRIYDRFRGVPAIVKALAAIGEPVDRSGVYRWNLPKSRGGTGGMVPTQCWPALFRAAMAEGIVLTAEDTFPGKVKE